MDIIQIGELVNYFAHGYISMDYQIIYNTALYDIPKLQKFLNKEIKEMLNK